MSPSSSSVVVVLLIVVVIGTLSKGAAAFLHEVLPQLQAQLSTGPTKIVRPDLKHLTDQQTDTPPLKIRLTVTSPEEAGHGWASQLSLTGMTIQLHPEAFRAGKNSPAKSTDDQSTFDVINPLPMPGANGPYPHLSSGPRRLTVLQSGHYINLLGTQTVQTLNGCWEICWAKDRPAGTLICGFEIPRDYLRNAAYIPQGQLYLSFPVWTPTGLEYGQENRIWAERKCQQMLEERDEELRLFDETNNPLMKAYHLYRAYRAIEHYKDMPHRLIDSIPKSSNVNSDSGVIQLKESLLLSRKGIVYCKSESPLVQKLGYPADDFVYLGSAKIAAAPASIRRSSTSTNNKGSTRTPKTLTTPNDDRRLSP